MGLGVVPLGLRRRPQEFSLRSFSQSLNLKGTDLQIAESLQKNVAESVGLLGASQLSSDSDLILRLTSNLASNGP